MPLLKRPKVMQWSKVRTRIMDFLAPEVRRRVDFHLTCYRERMSHDEVGRAWITIDGEQVLDCSHYRWMHEFGSAAAEAKRRYPDEGPHGLSSQAGYQIYTETERATEILAQRAIHETSHLYAALRGYPSLSITDAIASSNPLIRAVAMLDRRVGKRTLSRLRPHSDDHPLVRRFHALRVSASATQPCPCSA